MAFDIDQLSLALNQKLLFQPLTVHLEPGEIGTVMGPSGSGKSTLLAAISGTLLPMFELRGDIQLNDQSLLTVPIEHRQVGILFQDDLLFPHLNVYQNLVFALPGGLAREQKRGRIVSALGSAGLASSEQRDVATLSGGQRARVSLLRTLLAEPRLILLDEPFSKLDQHLRGQFRDWVFSRIIDLAIPALMVTHDPADRPELGTLITLEAPHA